MGGGASKPKVKAADAKPGDAKKAVQEKDKEEPTSAEPQNDAKVEAAEPAESRREHAAPQKGPPEATAQDHPSLEMPDVERSSSIEGLSGAAALQVAMAAAKAKQKAAAPDETEGSAIAQAVQASAQPREMEALQPDSKLDAADAGAVSSSQAQGSPAPYGSCAESTSSKAEAVEMRTVLAEEVVKHPVADGSAKSKDPESAHTSVEVAAALGQSATGACPESTTEALAAVAALDASPPSITVCDDVEQASVGPEAPCREVGMTDDDRLSEACSDPPREPPCTRRDDIARQKPMSGDAASSSDIDEAAVDGHGAEHAREVTAAAAGDDCLPAAIDEDALRNRSKLSAMVEENETMEGHEFIDEPCLQAVSHDITPGFEGKDHFAPAECWSDGGDYPEASIARRGLDAETSRWDDQSSTVGILPKTVSCGKEVSGEEALWDDESTTCRSLTTAAQSPDSLDVASQWDDQWNVGITPLGASDRGAVSTLPWGAAVSPQHTPTTSVRPTAGAAGTSSSRRPEAPPAGRGGLGATSPWAAASPWDGKVCEGRPGDMKAKAMMADSGGSVYSEASVEMSTKAPTSRSAPSTSLFPEPPLFDDSYRLLLRTADLDSSEDREPRDFALSMLQTNAAIPQNKRPMWEDIEGTRRVILASAIRRDPVDVVGRRCALATIWNLAGHPANRKDMWGDEATRAAVLDAVASEVAEVREVGLGVCWNLSPMHANAKPMWREEAARSAIITAAVSERPQCRKGRAFAMAVLQNLAEHPDNRIGMWGDAGVRSALVRASWLTECEDRDLRGRAIGALMNLSAEDTIKQDMWNGASGARAALAEAATLEPGKDDKSRTCALAALWSLALEPKNRIPMRQEKKVRMALLRAAESSLDASDTTRRARERALGSLHSLSMEPANKKAIWEDKDMRAAIIVAARGPGDGCIRAYGLGALWHLSSCRRIQERMWQDARGARSAVLAAGRGGPAPDDKKLQSRAMAVIWSLSAAEGNRAAMWADAQGARSQLLDVIAATHGCGEGHRRQARQHALGALRNLAEEPGLRATIWSSEEGARRQLLEAAKCNMKGDQVSSKRAFKTLCTLAYESANRESMWKDEAGARAQIVAGSQVPAQGRSSDVHLCALRALQALSVRDANKTEMWRDMEVRNALIDSANLDDAEASKARVCALSTLKNLATEAATMEGMWNDERVRSVLVRAAAAPGDAAAAEDPRLSRARAVALGVLRNIASDDFNKVPMWADQQGARAAVLAAAGLVGEDLSVDAREARMHAVATLRCFAWMGPAEGSCGALQGSAAAGGCQGPLWRNCERAVEVLVAAAQLSTAEHVDHKCQEHAAAALRHAIDTCES